MVRKEVPIDTGTKDTGSDELKLPSELIIRVVAVACAFLSESTEPVPDQFVGDSPVRNEEHRQRGMLKDSFMSALDNHLDEILVGIFRDLVLGLVGNSAGAFDELGIAD